MRASHRPRHRGFSITELLVVMGIILLLLAILIPSFAGARQTTRLAQCQVNLKQMAYHTEAYFVESFQAFPLFEDYDRLMTRESMSCPNDLDEPYTMLSELSSKIDEDLPMSMGLNKEIYAFRIAYHRIRRPTQMAVFFDGMPSDADNGTVLGQSNGESTVDLISVLPGAAASNVTIAYAGATPHLSIGAIPGRLDANGVDVGANSASTFLARHPISNDVGNVIFADWHVEFFQDEMQARHFEFPGNGTINDVVP